MKRLCVSVVVLLLTTGFLFAGGNQEGTPTEGEGDGEPTVLTLLISTSKPLSGLEAVIEAAEKDLNIKVEVDIRPGGTEGDNIVKTRLATGDMADICVYNSGSLFQALNPAEHFADLSGEAFIDRLDESYIETVSDGNKIFGIPFSSTQAGGWLYNKRIYRELGLSIPHTWDELLANCEVIKAAGITPVIGSYKNSWTAQLIFLADNYNVVSADPDFPEKYTIGEAKFAEHPVALRSWEKLSDSNAYMNRDYLATTYEVAQEMLAQGEGAHYPMLTQVLPLMGELYPESIDDIGVFGQPGDSADDHGLTVWMPDGMYINVNSPNVEAAKEFFEFYISDKALAVYSSKMKPEGPYALKDVELPADSYAGVLEMQSYFDEGKIAPALEFLSPLKGSSAAQICVECGAGMKSAVESAASYDNDVRKQAIQLGLPGWE